MKAKDLKDLIANIPDDARIEFTYSMFTFSRATQVLKNEEIDEYFESETGEAYDEDTSNLYMIEFGN